MKFKTLKDLVRYTHEPTKGYEVRRNTGNVVRVVKVQTLRQEVIKWIKEIQKALDKIEEDYNKKPVSPACSGDITIGGCEFSWALPDYEDFSSAIKILKHVHNITEEDLKDE